MCEGGSAFRGFPCLLSRFHMCCRGKPSHQPEKIPLNLADRFQPSLYRAYKCRFADLPPEKYADENTTRIVFVIYIFSDFTRVRFRGKRMKNIPQSWVWADRFPFNDLFHAIIYFIARINVDSSLSRGHWKLENCNRAKREGQFFFFNFLEFSMLQRKNFVPFYKKKKFLRISSIDSPFNRYFRAMIHFIIARINVIICHWISENCSRWREFFYYSFFFSNFTRCSISKGNFTEFSFIDLRLFPLSHRRFTVLISHRIPENYIRREQTVAFFSSKRILLNFSLKFRFDLQIRSCNCRPSTNIVENVFSLSLSPSLPYEERSFYEERYSSPRG